MKSTDDPSKTQPLKPIGKGQAPGRLAEDGPPETEGKKPNPFRKFLNNLWGPVRG
jgi:hypothetical protein